MDPAPDLAHMTAAVQAAATARFRARPNPWVGCVLVGPDGVVAVGATGEPGGPHAEVDALSRAAGLARGATAYVTLEPCSHHGRTPPCADALVTAGVARVVVGVLDPDSRVSGAGVARLEAAGIDVTVGVGADAVEAQLRPYLHQRRTGRPEVVLKLASTLDGRTAAADGTSRWITGSEARTDVHRLRAEADVIVVGAGTVRADDPTLTVRHVEGPDPERVVLGRAPAAARVHPCTEWTGSPGGLLDELAGRGAVQVLVEGGARVAGEWHRAGLVDRYVIYLAPALGGGDDGPGLFAGPGAASIGDVWRGRIESITPFGDDLRIDLVPGSRSTSDPAVAGPERS